MADRRLQVFHAVARLLSFTRAAEELCMTQPAVTFQVKQLEEQFNTRLFERSHARISLTPTGQVVFDYADRILRLNEELDTRIGEMTGGVRGPLLLGASLTIAEFILPRILGEFKARYPDVRTQMTVANSERIETRVADHSLDVGLIESPSTLSSLHTEICCEDELVLICASTHRLAPRAAVTPQEVAAEPFVSRETGSGTREFTDQYFRQAGISPDDLNLVMELGSPEAIKGLVETGLGVSIMSRMTIAKELRLATLVAKPLEPRLIRILSLVYPRDRFQSRLVKTFVDFALTRMKLPVTER
ncbi:MAG: LysR family transcriptional regulator [Proteobacteria bacterium]|nr:LysR family transcriptional regulator [Burkholderiales bacterium]